MGLALVWAVSIDGFIGRDGTLPWHLPEDLARFRELTAGHPVIMGRRTWDSLPARFRPLPGRENIVLSREPTVLDGARAVGDVTGAVRVVAGREAWVIGGAEVYAAFLPVADRLEVTEVDVVVGNGTAAPHRGDGWDVVGLGEWRVSTTGLRYRFLTYRRPPAGPTAPCGTAAER